VVVSADGERSVLVEEEIDDRAEIGDFISYYTFDGSGDVTDRSGNGNDGTLEANGGNLPKRKGSGSGSYIEFSEADGSLDVGDLQTVGPAEVDEITIALRYEITGGQSTQELMQHRSGNFAWYMETRDADQSTGDHKIKFNIGWATQKSESISSGTVSGKQVHVVVGTYDGSEMVLYHNGAKVGTESISRNVGLGQLWVAGGSGSQNQYMTGNLSFNSERIPPFTAGVNRVSLVAQPQDLDCPGSNIQ